MPQVQLKPKKERSLRRWHPWVFSGAIGKVRGAPEPGQRVEVLDHKGRSLGWGAYSPASQIRVRMWSFDPDLEPDEAWLAGQIAQALKLREPLESDAACDAYRLLYGESDGLPGLIVDRYGDWLVCQFLAAGVEAWREAIVEQLVAQVPGVCGIYERSDSSVRKKEGLKLRSGLLWGEQPPEQLAIREASVRFGVDVRGGHKTGFYLDQRDNRAAVARWSPGMEVLNCFSYTGGFGIAAAMAGAAHVTHIDASGPALTMARHSCALNDLDPEASAWVEGDVFQILREYRAEGRSFDLIVMDPPKFIESKRHVEKGCRGYKDINLLAFGLLRPGGRLFTFSCSGLLSEGLFQKVVADAALDAGRRASILQRLSQPLDHPVGLAFPEAAYLKGLVCQVLDGA